MKFSEKYGIVRQQNDDWYDTFLPADTNLFIDPFLIWEEDDGFWASAHAHLIEFFDMVFQLIQKSNGDPKSIYWKQASNLLIFPEPPEFCLGVADGTPLGSGSGAGLQQDMLTGVGIAVGLGMYKIAHMETISLFQGGMGVDRIGDCVCNVLKSYFIEYTQEICRRHNVPTERFTLQNAAWSTEFSKWQSKACELPTNTITYMRRGTLRSKKIATLLTPERFLRDIPVAEPDGFWNWSWANMAKELRGDFNFDVARNVARNDKARLARANPDAVALYLKHLEEEEKGPYPLDQDPRRLVKWYADGAQFVPPPGSAFIPEKPEQFVDFVRGIIESYRHGLEDSDAWTMLWHNGVPSAERVAQALFRSVAIHYCRANNVDLTAEANAGRGPVDFKFSAGWSARALVETKLVKSSGLWNGVLAQQPTYQMAEGVECGFYVAIAYGDDEYTEVIRKKLEKAANLSSEHYGIHIEAILVDARRKESGSKLKNQSLSNELHRDTGDDDN